MENKMEGEIGISLDKRRVLKLTFRACALFEKWTGMTVDRFFYELGRSSRGSDKSPTEEQIMEAATTLRIDRVAALLAACLQHDESKITPEDAMELMEHAKGNSMAEKLKTIIEHLGRIYAARQGYQLKEVEAAGTPPADPPKSSGNGKPD